MRIAFITDDGRTISAHFGRARYYAVLTVENGQIVERELRPKPGHAQFSAQESHGAHDGPHGTDPASQSRHTSMAEAIRDCEALICGGMGYGAYQAMRELGIKPVVTDEVEIEAALRAYLEGHLEDHTERLH
ncbi:MAG: dinitrogenase iron-molybdenum cofactor biosynthesis protein [Chloroflexi bacterium]|nr:dinitrogenase iron-molybdenum cofactor biosynthesis protein [Chloroflexota bacterium]